MHRLLVVDDEPMNLEILREYLEAERFEVIEAEDGEAALSALEAEERGFDAVVLDRMMPRLDGMEVLRRMRRSDRWRDVPVVLQTAATTKEQIAEGLREGAYYYLPKPYHRDVLLAVIWAAIGRRAAMAQLQRELDRGNATVRLLREARFSLRTPSEARAVAGLLSGICPDPALALLGLMELCNNAIEHGCLAVPRLEKEALVKRGAWDAELERLAGANGRARGEVQVEFRRTPGALEFRVRDNGAGFDWQRHFAAAEHGGGFHASGVAFCRDLAFDQLVYEDGGRVAVATVLLGPSEK